MGPKKYIERMVMQYEGMFGTKPKDTYTSPLMSNDHPELDTTELLDDDGIHQYHYLIGVPPMDHHTGEIRYCHRSNDYVRV
jgi:hypothetical protein